MFIGENAQNGHGQIKSFATTSSNFYNNELPNNDATSASSLAFATTSKAIILLQENSYLRNFQNSTIAGTNINATSPMNNAGGLLQMRLALTLTHILLVSLGTVNLLVILVILLRPYMRSITNVYMISLCLADFIYLGNLTLVAATQLNEKSWPFSSTLCTLYHGTETTGKYASVLFVVLLAADRYCAMCKPTFCNRHRNYSNALMISALTWTVAIGAAFPLYSYSELALLRFRGSKLHKLCIAKWPSSDIARWYIIFSSIFIFALPILLISYFYYQILNKLREALRSCKRLKRGASSEAPYHRVTRLVLWVVIFHLLCWAPFWVFNLFSSIFRLRVSTQIDRIVVNIIHLFPYINCALNPFLYAANAENFRIAFRSLFCRLSSCGARTALLGFNASESRFEDNRLKSCIGAGSIIINTSPHKTSSTYIRTTSGIASALNASSDRLLNTHSINTNSGANASISNGNFGINNGSVSIFKHTLSKYSLNHTNNIPNSSSTSSGLIESILEGRSRSFGSQNPNNSMVLPLPYDKVKPFNASNSSVSILLDKSSWALHNQQKPAALPLSIKNSFPRGEFKNLSFTSNDSAKERINATHQSNVKASNEVLALEANPDQEKWINENNSIFLADFNNIDLEDNGTSFISNHEEDVLI